MKRYRYIILMMSFLTMMAGCSSENAFFEEVNTDTFDAHIHGMDFVDGELMLATHYGLLKKEEGKWFHSTSNNHDYMGFTSYGEGLYASGHPEVSSDAQNPLGLIKSNDQGETLESLAFSGQTDYHHMAVGKDTGRLFTVLMESNEDLTPGIYYSDTEGENWVKMTATGLQGEAILGLTAHPTNPNQLAVVTDLGVFETTDAGERLLLKEDSEGTSAFLYTSEQHYRVKNERFTSSTGIQSVIPISTPVLYLAFIPRIQSNSMLLLAKVR